MDRNIVSIRRNPGVVVSANYLSDGHTPRYAQSHMYTLLVDRKYICVSMLNLHLV